MKTGWLTFACKGLCASVVMTTLAGCQLMPATQTGALSEGSGSTLQMAAEEAEAKHNYRDAANAYGRLYAQNRKSPALLSAYLRNSRYSGNSLNSIAYFESEVTQLRTSPDVKFEYGKALIAVGRNTDAVAALDEVIAQNSQNWQVHSAKGIALDALGNYKAASNSYLRALGLSPNNEVVLNNLAMSQAMQGQLSLAVSTLEKAALVNRQNPHIRQNLALLYAVQGNVKKARALASMDLNAGDLETNLSFYRRFEGAKK